MPITLTAISGPEPGKVLQLEMRQSVRVGRGEGLELSFPEDLQMSTQHFQIEGQLDCALLRDLQSTNGTFVNGSPITEVLVGNGDRILAGETTFAVATHPTEPLVSMPTEPAPGAKVSLGGRSTEVCEGLFLTDEARPLLQDEQTTAELLDALTENELYADALRVLSRAMGTPAAVIWACDCAREALPEMSPAESRAVDAAGQWGASPSQEAAAAAYTAAEALEQEGPAAMLALAAYWGMGDASAPDQPPLPVDEQLPSQSIAGALTLIACDQPEEAAEIYQGFISRAVPADE